MSSLLARSAGRAHGVQEDEVPGRPVMGWPWGPEAAGRAGNLEVAQVLIGRHPQAARGPHHATAEARFMPSPHGSSRRKTEGPVQDADGVGSVEVGDGTGAVEGDAILVVLENIITERPLIYDLVTMFAFEVDAELEETFVRDRTRRDLRL